MNSIRVPSPTGDIDDLDYIDLLLEYKQIQKQLEHLSKEEQGTVSEVIDVEKLDTKTENSEAPGKDEKATEDEKASEIKEEVKSENKGNFVELKPSNSQLIL